MVLEYLEERQISVWAVAKRMDADSTHLRRVLTGRRPGSQELLKSVLDTAQSMPTRHRSRRHEDTERLIGAAAHMFFLRRGDFESAIFNEPNEMEICGMGLTWKRPEPQPRKREKLKTGKDNL